MQSIYKYRYLIATVLVVLLIISIWQIFLKDQIRLSINPAPRMGSVAPDFTLSDQNNNSVGLSQYLGKPVLVTFWASWCSACSSEFPGLNSVYQKFMQKGFSILAINLTSSDDLASITSFLDISPVGFPILLDPDHKVLDEYQVAAIPTAFLIDKKGIIAKVFFGAISEEDLTSSVNELLQSSK